MVVPHIGHIFLLSLIYAVISSFRIPSGAFIVASGCLMGTGFPARLICLRLGSECHGSGYETDDEPDQKHALILLAEMLGYPWSKRSPGFRDSCEQRCQIDCRYNPRGFVTNERKQPALVTCHKIIGLACFGQGQEKIIGRIG